MESLGQKEREPDQISQEIVSILDSDSTLQSVDQLSLNEYRNFVLEKAISSGMTTNILDDHSIKKIIDYIDDISDLHIYFPEKSTCLIIIMPCDTNGNPLNEEQLSSFKYVVPFILKCNFGENINSLQSKNIAHYLPPEIQKVAFDIPEYLPLTEDGKLQIVDRANLLADISRALFALQTILKLPNSIQD